MKKYIVILLLIAFIALFNCTRVPNPFSAVKKQPEATIDVYPVGFWKNSSVTPYMFDTEFVVYNPDYDLSIVNTFIIQGDWYNFPESLNKKNYESGCELLYCHNSVYGAIIYEHNVKGVFTPSGVDSFPPNILNIIGPNGGTFTPTSPPDIRIVVQETNITDGLYIQRYYSFYVVDIYGNVSEPYTREIKYVMCTAEFVDAYSWFTGNITSATYKYVNLAEVIRTIQYTSSSQEFEVRLLFNPLDFSGWASFSDEWILISLHIGDNSENFTYCDLQSDGEYYCGGNQVGDIIIFSVQDSE